MKAFLDTSVLVPVFYGDHTHHAASLDLFTRFKKSEAGCAAHSLVEVYATLTRMPGQHRVDGATALLFIGDLQERLTVVSLTSGEYADLLRSSAARGIAGGTIYDAVIARCAVKTGAEKLFSWNLRHYALLGPEVTARLAPP